MSTSQASILINEEMDDVKTVVALKANTLMNQLRENRRYTQVAF